MGKPQHPLLFERLQIAQAKRKGVIDMVINKEELLVILLILIVLLSS